MTTREELVELLCEFFLDKFKEDAAGVGDWLAQGEQDADVVIPAVEALKVRLASRQEVSVEELARVIDPIAFGIKPSMYGLRSQQELERHVFVSGVRGVARDKACALLAKYSITNRTE